jgi:hypothetical protein
LRSQPTNETRQTRRWEGPLFIVGMPRSGTKLLRGLLIQHPRIRIPLIETEFLPYLVRWVARHGPPSSEESFARLTAQVRTASYFDYRHGGRPFTSGLWQAACNGKVDAAGLFEGFVRLEVDAPQGSGLIWGDKSPTYIRHLGMLLEQFPTARVVHIVRDPRDYCLSMYNAWRKDMLRAASRWGADVLQACRLCADNRDRCVEIRYEMLLGDPERELRKICEAIGVDVLPAMLQLDHAVENLGDAKGRSGIVDGNHGKFRNRLPAKVIGMIEALAWDAMLALEYRPEVATGPRRLNSMSLAARRLLDGVRLVTHDAEHRGIRRSLRFYLNHQRVVK